MLKVLVKKQLAEILRGFVFDSKRGKGRTASSIAIMALVGLLIVGMVAAYSVMMSVMRTPYLSATTTTSPWAIR